MTDTQPQFDVFLAHNSLDKEYIRNINQKLKRSRLKTWLDEEAILGGQIIQDEIQKVIPRIKSAAIFIGKQGLGRWQKVELRSLYTQCVEKDVIVIPVLLPGVIDFPQDLVFLKEHKWVSFVNSIEDEEALKELKSAIRQRRLTSKPTRLNKQQSTLNTTSKSSTTQMTNMGLSGQQRKQLQEALIKAFPKIASLESMLSFELDKSLRAIAGEGSLQDLVFELIITAEAEEWVEDLVRAARESNPRNTLLKAIAEELLPNDDPETHQVPSPSISVQPSDETNEQPQFDVFLCHNNDDQKDEQRRP